MYKPSATFLSLAAPVLSKADKLFRSNDPNVGSETRSRFHMVNISEFASTLYRVKRHGSSTGPNPVYQQ